MDKTLTSYVKLMKCTFLMLAAIIRSLKCALMFNDIIGSVPNIISLAKVEFKSSIFQFATQYIQTWPENMHMIGII